MKPGILSMSRLATGKIAFKAASGLMVRPVFKLYFLMYTQTFFVTSVRAIFLPPQIFANGSLSVFGAKSPTPLFFMAAATFLPLALLAALPAAFFVALSVAFVAFVIVGFFVFVVVVATVVFVVVVIAIEELQTRLSLE